MWFIIFKVFLNGFHGDCSEMFEVGKVDDGGKKLINVSEMCLKKAIEICKPNEKLCSIGKLSHFNSSKNKYKLFLFVN